MSVQDDVERYGGAARERRLGRGKLAELIIETEGDGCAGNPMWRARKILEALAATPGDGDSIEITEGDDGSVTVDARGMTAPDPAGQALVKTVDDLIEASGLDTSRYRQVGDATINTWTTSMMQRTTQEDSKGCAHVVSVPVVIRNWQVKARFERRLDAASLGIQIPPVMYATERNPPQPRTGSAERALVISDPQIGFRRDRKGRYEPLHDRLALDVALQLAALIQPQRIIWIGDNLDASEASVRWATGAADIDTIQPALLEIRYWLGAFRATCPSAHMVMLEGNHGKRVRDIAIQRLAGLAEVSLPGEYEPAISLKRFLQPEDFGVEYVAPYGESHWWHGIEFHHGDTVRAGGGKTVAATLAKSEHSRVYGHVHREEVAHRTVVRPYGPKRIFHASVGCSCRLDFGVVPGVKHERDWQQAQAVVTVDLERGTEAIETVSIDRGRAYYGGTMIDARDHTQDVEDETGWPMARFGG